MTSPYTSSWNWDEAALPTRTGCEPSWPASHGTSKEQDVAQENFLVVHDTDPDDLFTTGIDMQQLTRLIKSRVHCQRIVIILDACHSGGAKDGCGGLSQAVVDLARGKEAEHEVIVYCKSNPDVKIIKAIDIVFTKMRKEQGIVLSK